MSKRSVPAAVRRVVTERSGGCCEYCQCQQKFSPDTFSVEHIIPKILTEDDSVDNLAFSCQGCNSHKAIAIDARDPETGSVVPLYHPRLATFDEHFEWNTDFTLLIG